jgi:guanine deaminase
LPHLSEGELARLSAAGAVAVSCPTSNTFLGSGLFDWARARDQGRPVRTALATDVGGGTSYSMLRTAGEMYKILSLQGQRFSPDAAVHALTRGNAMALGMGERIGTFASGHECDAVVLDSCATPAMRHRMKRAESLDDELFVLVTMGDDRSVVATYVMGQRARLVNEG